MTERTFEKYKMVVDEWFTNGFNGRQAYLKFYTKSKEKTAEDRFSKIQRIAEVSEYIETKRKQIALDAKLTLDDVVKLISDIATFDLAECYDEDGKLKNIHDIPKEVRSAIMGLDVTEEYTGMGAERELVGYTKKLRAINKLDALKDLMKHLGGYKLDNDQKTVPVLQVINMSDYKKDASSPNDDLS